MYLNQKLSLYVFQQIFTEKAEGRLPIFRSIHLVDHLPDLVAPFQGKFSLFTALQDHIQSLGQEPPDIEEYDLPDVSWEDFLVILVSIAIGGLKIDPLIGQDKFAADLFSVCQI